MSGLTHLDLDVLFGRSEGGYQVQILRSPAGEGQSVAFAPPFTDLELENFILKVGRFRARTRRVESAPVAAAKLFGGQLFDAVFTGSVGECLRRSLDRAQHEQATLRIRLRLSDCSELADLPWELLYDRSDDWFLALSDHTPVVRYVQLPVQPRPMHVTLPLRVLVIRSEPFDCPRLDLQAEWAQVAAAVSELTDAGALAFTELAAPTLSELRRALLRDTFHVLHYMGHGGFDQQHGGVLLFTDQAGRSLPVTAGDLGVLLHDHTSMRLAVLNACQAGRTDPADPFAGVADTLVRRGIPAVIAMQFEVTDDAAIEFAPALYGALAAGRPVDTAVSEARKAIYTISPLEWATPVLYLRADDALLFDVTQHTPPQTITATTHLERGDRLRKQVLSASPAVTQPVGSTVLDSDAYAKALGILVVDSAGAQTLLLEYGIFYRPIMFGSATLGGGEREGFVLEKGSATQMIPWSSILRITMQDEDSATVELRDGRSIGPVKPRSGTVVGTDEFGFDFTLELSEVKTISFAVETSVPEWDALLHDIPDLVRKKSQGGWTASVTLDPQQDKVHVTIRSYLNDEPQGSQTFEMPGPSHFRVEENGFGSWLVAIHAENCSINLGPYDRQTANTIAKALTRLNTLSSRQTLPRRADLYGADSRSPVGPCAQQDTDHLVRRGVGRAILAAMLPSRSAARVR